MDAKINVSSQGTLSFWEMLADLTWQSKVGNPTKTKLLYSSTPFKKSKPLMEQLEFILATDQALLVVRLLELETSATSKSRN